MRALVFDLDGTLLQYQRAYDVLLAATFEEGCGCVDQVHLDSYSESFFEEFSACNDRPVERAFDRTGVSGDPEEFADRLLAAEIAATEPPAGAQSDLERLGDTFTLGVLTNGLPEWQRGKLAAHSLLDPFETVVTSYEVGAHKPDPAPFREVERRLDADAYAMIGDSDDDIDGAENAGWDALRYEGGRLSDVPEALDWQP